MDWKVIDKHRLADLLRCAARWETMVEAGLNVDRFNKLMNDDSIFDMSTNDYVNKDDDYITGLFANYDDNYNWIDYSSSHPDKSGNYIVSYHCSGGEHGEDITFVDLSFYNKITNSFENLENNYIVDAWLNKPNPYKNYK